MNLDEKKAHHGSSSKNLTFTRRYLDPNRVTYEVCARSWSPPSPHPLNTVHPVL